ncbi:RraA family protein [Aquamicrobium sp. LC103]|uniref:RraA family protein n=1 Tax=Aquamicrobium sp. LC103 TaxID=1120658 RepID=UPI00063E91E3|nr:RraA family protein [Aquamicrobium sp. LC103]TKT69839.1 RraA family protein [Aquamicrobium sp. LC103]
MTIERNDPFLERLSVLETGQISDVLDEAGLVNHALSSDLFALIPGQRFAGRAACLKGEPFVQGRTQKASVAADTMERITRPGTVLVIEAGDFQAGALLGGFVAYSLQQRGCTAIVTDGAIRDADEIRELGLQCVQRTITPVNGARRWRQTVAGETVRLPGQTCARVEIRDGDYVVGDGDGVVVIPAAVVGQIVEDTEELLRIEKKIGTELRAGGARHDVFKANPRFAHIRSAI